MVRQYTEAARPERGWNGMSVNYYLVSFKIILLLVIGIVCIWKGIMISIFCTKSRNWGPFSLGFLVIGFCSLIYAALLVSPGH